MGLLLYAELVENGSPWEQTVQIGHMSITRVDKEVTTSVGTDGAIRGRVGADSSRAEVVLFDGPASSVAAPTRLVPAPSVVIGRIIRDIVVIPHNWWSVWIGRIGISL